MSDIKKAAYIEEEKIYTSRKKEKVHLKNIVASKCPDEPSEYYCVMHFSSKKLPNLCVKILSLDCGAVLSAWP